jgi:hypothetical protein
VHISIGSLKPFVFRIIIEKYMLSPVILLIFFWLFLIMFVYFSHIDLTGFITLCINVGFCTSFHLSFYYFTGIYSFTHSHDCLYLYSSSDCKIPLQIFCNADLVFMNFSCLCLSWSYSKRRRGDEGEWEKGVNLTKIYCKHFLKMSQGTPSAIW